MKKLIILVVILLVAIGGYFVWEKMSKEEVVPKEEVTIKENTDLPETPAKEEVAKEEEAKEEERAKEGMEVIGKSVEGRDITAYHYGTGDEELLFVGGIHGGYEWNTVLLAYELIDYLSSNTDAIPENVRVTVVPVMNPDGLFKVVGTDGKFAASKVPAQESLTIPGRFNAQSVDLNRNFDCEWEAEGVWQTRKVSGGSEPFSEPEARAMRDYINANKPSGVVVYYSAAGGVFASTCKNGIMAETTALTNEYAKASGYKAYQSFDYYEITGDMVNWLAKSGIPAISVLLTTHKDVEWEKNLAGVKAILEYYAE